MKRFFIFVLCFLFLSSLVGCSSTDLKSGYYFLVGDYEEHTTPYVIINFEDNSFSFGNALIQSYAERGSFTVKGEKITATTQNTTFVFEIIDPSSIILIDCGEYKPFADYMGLEFAYSNDIWNSKAAQN